MECNIPDNTELENELVLEVVRPELLVGGNTVATFARLVAATLPAASVDIMKNSFIATIQVYQFLSTQYRILRFSTGGCDFVKPAISHSELWHLPR